MKAEIKPRIELEGRTRLETVIPLATPFVVFLDPSNVCNFTCDFCPTGNSKFNIRKYRKPEIMELGLYKKIIDDLCDMPGKIKVLRLYKDGESLLNPNLAKMIKYAKETGRFKQIDLTTNGSLLTPKRAAGLVVNGLDKVFISVPANYNEEYRDQIRNFYLHKEQCQIYVKIIGDGLDEGAKKRFYDDFGNIADAVFIENLMNCWSGFDVQGVNKKIGIYGQPIEEIQACAYCFYSLAINSNGTVSICFLDWSHQNIIGDLNRESFRDVWNGSRLRRFQIKMLTDRKQFPFCANCQQLKYGAADNLDQYRDEILRRLG